MVSWLRPRAALTFDLEEWFHGLPGPPADASALAHQAGEATAPILSLLERHGVRATFFTVGEVAQDQPELLRRLVAAGHEIGFHGLRHRAPAELGPAAFVAELREFRAILVDVVGTGAPVPLGYRAPWFALGPETAWVLGALADEGYLYDASIFPLRTPLYGHGNAPRVPYPVSLADPLRIDVASPVIELPATVARLGPAPIPAAGGVYLRLTPGFIHRWLFLREARRAPAMLYLHPHETFAQTPTTSSAPAWRRRLRAFNSASCLPKLEALLRRVDFVSAAAIAREVSHRES